jgi:hypothetical protein
MATDAQGRQLSDDGFYYWDGSEWQPVQKEGESEGHEQEGSEGGASPEIQALLKKMADGEELTDDEYDKVAEAEVEG